MKKTASIIRAFSKKVVLSVILILILAPSCVNPKDKARHDGLIPEKAFASILTDIYIANGLLTLPDIRRNFGERDSVQNFIDVIEGHGYSYEQMNNTMNYYFVSKPKKLIRIYDQIIGNLSETEAAMQKEILRLGLEESRKQAKYNLYHFPDASRMGNPGTTINIPSAGTYTITLSVTISPDDQSYNPHFSAWLVDADSVETGRKKWLPDLKYIKDGHPHQYFYTGRIEEKRPMVMKAILFEYENNIEEWERNATIEILFSGFTPIQE
jgi:hypothetical protein